MRSCITLEIKSESPVEIAISMWLKRVAVAFFLFIFKELAPAKIGG